VDVSGGPLPAADAPGAAAPPLLAEVPFHPRPRLRVRWSGVLVVLSALLGGTLLAAGVALRFGRLHGLAGVPLAGRGMDLIALGFLVGAAPYAFLVWWKRRRLAALDARLPDFLTDLASLHKAGLTLHESVVTAAKGDYGPLTREVRIAADQVRWNVPVLTALESLQRRVGTAASERTLAVVLEAGRTGGNVPEVLELAAGNARAIVALREQRARTMGLYTIITYVASLIFIGVALALQGIFVPKMVQAFSNVQGGGLALASSVPTLQEFRDLFYAAALVQAVGNGLVGGIMSDGSALAGLRHSVIMALLCFLGFLAY
jgi:flagellar protein FlaJ